MALDIADALLNIRSPVSLRRAVLDFRSADPTGFREAARQVCLEMLSGSGPADLLRNAVTAGLVEYFVADPDILDCDSAEALVREAQHVDSSVGLKFAQHALAPDSEFALKMKFRLVDLLGKVLEDSKLAIPIGAMLARADPVVRSRAAIALGGNQSTAWLRDHLQHEDPRVRANALESLWPDVSDAHVGLLRVAAMDANNRVRGNALYGLYLLRAEGVRQQILAMSRHPDATFRSTAAWVMGETMDPEFLAQLQAMVRTERGAARMSALRALARLRSERRSHAGAQDAATNECGSVGLRIEDRAID